MSLLWSQHACQKFDFGRKGFNFFVLFLVLSFDDVACMEGQPLLIVETPFALLMNLWACGFAFHVVLHFLVLPTASKLWDFAFVSGKST